MNISDAAGASFLIPLKPTAMMPLIIYLVTVTYVFVMGYVIFIKYTYGLDEFNDTENFGSNN